MIRIPVKSLPGFIGEYPPLGVSDIPSVPVLSAPDDAAEVAHAAFAPAWAAARRATSYDLQTATDSGFTSGVVTTSVAPPTASPGLSAGTYYWRVRAKNRAGVSAWSAGRSVTLT